MREIERIINKKFIMGEMPSGKQICEQQLIKLIDDIEKVKVTTKKSSPSYPESIVNWNGFQRKI